MALEILGVDGSRVYVGGYVDVAHTNENGQDTIHITGLDVQDNESYSINVEAQDLADGIADTAAATGHPGFWAGNLLKYVAKKIKQAVCPTCA